ncbi:alpha-2-macroglobulin-like protein 1 [Malaclemys terrapin pileata]|uniref:alpha-2-macroglobulin-like protein 1 n=1 Tax=Malaclemys terrapin pileata TaxID=2991368 RepID=UPI0023A90286|nr:alpha-2-macroglobulin-like protein 1 [Malaclemys terrapin pileata]
MWTAITLSCLLHFVATSPILRYMVVIPADLHYPSSQAACVHINYNAGKLYATLVLERSGGQDVLLRKEITKEKTFECVKFQVVLPANSTEEVARIKLFITGRRIDIHEEKKVLIRRVNSGTFIQTDKPIYKPGQTVKFRIVTLNEDFIPLNDMYPLVFLQDPNNNRIGQWLDVAPQEGIADLYFQLAAEPPLGTYIISVAKEKAHSSFSVEEYVLPKFEVVFEEPTQIYALDKTFPLRVCGRYTYGKGVQGTIQVSLCQKSWWYFYSTQRPPLCHHYNNQTDKMGCFSTSVYLSSFNQISPDYRSNVDAVVTLVEDGTEVQVNASHSFFISRTAGTATFEEVNPYYYTGEIYRGKIKIVDHQGKAMNNTPVYLILSYTRLRFNKTYITDDSGSASFELNTNAWNGDSVSLEGRFLLQDPVYVPGTVNVYYQNAYHFIQPLYSTTKSFLRIVRVPGTVPCGKNERVQVDFRIYEKDLSYGPKSVDFSYYVIGKVGIVLSGQKTFLVGSSKMMTGTFFIPLVFTSNYAPAPTIVVYVIFPTGGIIADSAPFSVSMCFKNEVKIGFSEDEALPGSEVSLQLQAAPRSLCAVRAVDQSVLLMRPEKELSNSLIYGLFPHIFRGGYPYQVSEDDFLCWSREPHQPDVFMVFREMGLKIISNTHIKKPRECTTTVAMTTMMVTELESTLPMLTRPTFLTTFLGSLTTTGHRTTISPPAPPVEEKVRKYFPETWIWDLFSVGPTGNRDVPVTVPDTITEWKAGMFCTSEVGFGLAPTTSLLAFKPFFVEPTLPYSVIRGETFTLKATVYNYLLQCIKIKVTLAESPNFQLEPCEGCVYSSCLCANEAKTFNWRVTAKQLGSVNITLSTEALATKDLCGGEVPFIPERGRTDTLIKPLLVQPEGVLVEKAHSSLLCPKGVTPVQDSVSLELPPDVVEGSARATISVMGDIMGTALQNLDRLVQMPSGCGEQNMVLFAPIIYVLQYLEKTGQLTPEIRERATGFLRSGYQRQLLYKHHDGSYSAFGTTDQEGNTWLTAFVAKCFGQARPYIFLDDKNIRDALSWLQIYQLPSGCFRSVGKLFHTAMKGGVDGEVPLAAYITAAHLEIGEALNSTVVNKALSCLTSALPNITSTYTQALLAYAFALAHDTQRTQELLTKLDQKAIRTGGQIYWSQAPSQPPSAGVWSQPQSVDVELTSYVLLALLSKLNVTGADVATASGIVAWLTKQQNAYGGFASTQDTVVALQGLAKYAALTYSEKGDSEVIVKSKGGFERKFQVTHKNRLLLQQAVLTEIPGEFSVQAQGSGCIYAQTVLRYNEPPPQVSATFSVRITTQLIDCTKGDVRVVTIRIHVSYIGSRVTSNMVIVEVSLLSGFSLASGSLTSLQSSPLVRKTEVSQSGVSIYLDQLSNTTQTYVLQLEQEIEVINLKPGHIRVYDYYQPEEQALANYSAICS